MNEPSNFSERIASSAKDLTRSGTGLSAIIIFSTLLMLGVIFGLKFQQQSVKSAINNPSLKQDIQVRENIGIRKNNPIESEQLSPPLDDFEDNTSNIIGPMNQPMKQDIDVVYDPTFVSEQSFGGASPQTEDYDYSVQPTEQIIEINKFVSEEQKNSEKLETQADQLKEIIESKDEPSGQQIISLVDAQLEERGEIIRKEESSVEDLMSSNENREIFSEPMKNGYTQATEAEKELDQQINDYVERLSVDNVPEATRNQIGIAVSETLEDYNVEKKKRRDRYINVYDQLSNDEISQSQQEKLAEMNEEEDLEYANLLRKHMVEMNKLVGEDKSEQNFIFASTDNLRLQLAQSQRYGEEISDSLKQLDEDHDFFVDANDPSKKLFLNKISRSSTEEDLDEKTLFLINQLPDGEEKQKLIARNNEIISERKKLEEKKDGIFASASSYEQSKKSQIAASAADYGEQINGLEAGLNRANQKIDMIYDILTNREIKIIPQTTITLEQPNDGGVVKLNEAKEAKEAVSNEEDVEKLFEQRSKEEKGKVKEESIEDSFYTFDQVRDENKALLSEQIISEQIEFDEFSGIDEMSESMKRKSDYYRNRLTDFKKPIFPMEARIKNIEGSCAVKFKINQEGKAMDANANCTNEIFLNPTEQTIEEWWEFEPDNYINPSVVVEYRLID